MRTCSNGFAPLVDLDATHHPFLEVSCWEGCSMGPDQRTAVVSARRLKEWASPGHEGMAGYGCVAHRRCGLEAEGAGGLANYPCATPNAAPTT
ncbi:hypothetical protein NDU88_005740 [Pleurodeles waltl]|uniref:Uncharacterized protein n=1 Tax=Pleurodeles waltl TaxID=8319 RepID=A0AAV7QGV1_PLEWA|nr:hypothetical protein NDU88_005740 [Pleurodeles waltl]